MRELRKIFSFSGYWLNSPPGTGNQGTTWTGKRKFMQSLGYGFLVLYQGKVFSDLKDGPDPAALGTADALAAIEAAQAEGFPERDHHLSRYGGRRQAAGAAAALPARLDRRR